MKIVDANVLLYAVNEDAEQHEASRSWLDGALSGGDVVGLDWVPLLAFVRIASMPSIFSTPLAVSDALAQVDDWLAAPGAHLVSPGRRHAALVADLLDAAGAGGANLVNDAHLAALALEHRATVVTFDTDFARFPGLRWTRPQ